MSKPTMTIGELRDLAEKLRTRGATVVTTPMHPSWFNKAADAVDELLELRALETPPLAAQDVAYTPKLIRYDSAEAGDPYREFIEADVASVTGPMRAANVEMLYDMQDRAKVIGMRVYDTTPSQAIDAGDGEAVAVVADLVRRLTVAADGFDKVSFDRLSLRRGYEKLLREAAAALAHPAAGRVSVSDEPQWQPINTAPRDGTPFLLARDGSVVRGRWWGGLTISADGYAIGWELHQIDGWKPLPVPPAALTASLSSLGGGE